MLNISDSVNKFADSLKINWPNFDIKPFDMPEMPEAINIKELMPDNAGKALFLPKFDLGELPKFDPVEIPNLNIPYIEELMSDACRQSVVLLICIFSWPFIFMHTRRQRSPGSIRFIAQVCPAACASFRSFSFQVPGRLTRPVYDVIFRDKATPNAGDCIRLICWLSFRL